MQWNGNLRAKRFALFLLVSVVGLAGLGNAGQGMARYDALADLRDARLATASYLDPERAIANGYQFASDCGSGPRHEFTGQRYVNYYYVQESLATGSLTKSRPAGLVYSPGPDGGQFRLAAVEYIVPDVGQARPKLFGQEFDGPHDPYHAGVALYDLRVWLWDANPDGIFARRNSLTHC